MLSRLVTAIAVGVFTVAGLASHASAFTEPIPVKISLLKWGGNPLEGKLYKIVSKPLPASQPSGLFQLPDATSSDPVTNGGTLEVEVGLGGSLGTLNCTLLGGAFDGTRGWKGLGSPAGSKGYKYTNKGAPTTDPCKTAIIKEKVIKVLAKNVGDIDPPTGANDFDVFTSITAGTDKYCAQAVPPHNNVIANSLIKMKDQAAPASCLRCGDDEVNLPGEVCDGTDDDACPGGCIAPGAGGDTCGDNLRNGGSSCTCAIEQCDGTDADQCAGLCVSNCTCPEPVCNNGVKEVGEVCDPAGSTADCGPSEVCGGFCECVSDLPCDCAIPAIPGPGQADPTMWMMRTSPPAYEGQICGTTDGSITPTLKCMGLYIGGGGGALPVPNMVADQSTTKFNIAQCVGTDITLGPTSVAQVGRRHCSEGRRCAGGSNAGQPCLRDRECPGSTCNTQCFYGSYIAILNKATPYLSTCVSDEIASDCSGGLDCVSGRTFTRIPMDSKVYLTGSDMSASTPGYQPCPICAGGTLDVPNSGICQGGPDKTKPCMPMTSQYDLYNCCSANSSNATQDCTDDSDCLGVGATCLSGCTEQPTSLDCRPHPLTQIGTGLLLALPMNTEGPDAYANTVVADENGAFCGWCRDTGLGSLCFEGNPDMPNAPKACPDSSVIACRPTTYHSAPPVGGHAEDIAECGDALRCRTDADCTYPYGTCTQRDPGAWRDAALRTVGYDTGSRPGDLRDGLPHPSTLVGNFCIPPSMDEVIDGNSDLGGPGGLSLIGNAKLE